MRKITAIISFLSSLGWFCFLIIMVIRQPLTSFEDYGIFIFLLLFITSNLVYIKLTEFGNSNSGEIDKIKYENEILKFKIEQKNLKKQLQD